MVGTLTSSEIMEQNNNVVSAVTESSEKRDYTSMYGLSAADSSSSLLGDTGRRARSNPLLNI